MEIEFKGGNCILINLKKTTIVVDPKLSMIGLKDQGEKADVVLLTQPRFAAAYSDNTVVIDGPGEYEVHNTSIRGVAALAYLDPTGSPLHATMYRLNTPYATIVIVGHIHASLDEEQLEKLGLTDILIVPIGGNGYTLDATGAVQLVRAINPKLIIPTHYAEAGVTYEVAQASIDEFVKELGVLPAEEVTTKLKLKGEFTQEALIVQPLTRTT